MGSVPPDHDGWTSGSSSIRNAASAFDRWFSHSSPWHLFVVLLLALVARGPILFALDTVTTGWHSADYGSIARNYYLHGFRFAYPEIDWGGAQPGYVEMEFPIVPFLTAVIYAIAGGPDDRLAVVIPLISGLFAVLFTYLLARELFRPSAAFLAGVVAALAPVSARYSELFFPEASLVAASVATVYFALLWLRTGLARHLAWAAIATSLAVLLKPTALVLGAPLLWLFWLRYGRTIWRQPAFYVFGIAVLIVPVWWYSHALQLAQQYGNSFGIMFGGLSKFATRDLLLESDFYTRLATRLTLYHLTPLPAIAAIWALLRVRFTDEQRVLPIWFWATTVGLFVAAKGNYDVPYYQLPLIPPACILAGVGLLQIERDLSLMFRIRRLQWAVPAACAAVLLAGAVVGRQLHYARADYVRADTPTRAAFSTLARSLRPGALIVYSEPSTFALERGLHVTPPQPFYFSGHRGWFRAPEWLTIEEMNALRRDGAEYFVVRNQSQLVRGAPAVFSYLASFPLVSQPTDYIVWDLTGRVVPSTVATAKVAHMPAQP